MYITKTKFINYTKCPKYYYLEKLNNNIKDCMDFESYKLEENLKNIEDLINMLPDEESVDKQLEVMLPYYNQVEIEAGKIASKYFDGKMIYAYNTKDQKKFSFSKNDNVFLCYVDIYNEKEDSFNIIEVKATTSNNFLSLKGEYRGKEKHSIFKKINNVLYLKDEIEDYDIELEMPIDKFYSQKEKLLDRFDIGSYVYDLAVQRFFIEQQYKRENKKLTNVHYYLAVLNSNYEFLGEYINNEPNYCKNGDEELINFIDLTKVTESMMPNLEKDLSYLELILSGKVETNCPLKEYCNYKTKKECSYFKKICGKDIPKENSSLCYLNSGFGFLINGEKVKGLDLINKGYYHMLDIPDEVLKNPNNVIQKECVKNNTIYIDKEKIRAGLEKIEYPIYHLDFETMPCPLPRFSGERPYTQSPFEFSLHIEREPGKCDFDKDNIIFLAANQGDNREELIKELIRNIDGSKGTLLAQNVSFEKNVIKNLAKQFPQYKDKLMDIYNRGFDLLWLVNNNSELYSSLGFDQKRVKLINYYHPALNGSYSIKKTLPVFSDLSYKELIVKNGTEAIVEYANYNNMTKEEFLNKYQALKDYCKQDTWAMVLILDALRNVVK